MFRIITATTLLAGLAACGSNRPPDPITMEGGPEEESAEVEAHAGESIVPPGWSGTFRTDAGTFAVRVVDVAEHQGVLTVSDPDPESLFADRTFDPTTGSYWVVELELVNTGTSPARFYRLAEAVTEGQVSYGPDEDASAALAFYRPAGIHAINPGATAPAFLVFDLPERPDVLALTPIDPTGAPLFLGLD